MHRGYLRLFGYQGGSIGIGDTLSELYRNLLPDSYTLNGGKRAVIFRQRAAESKDFFASI